MLSSKITKQVETSQLHNDELKRLANVMRGVPASNSAGFDAYHRTVKYHVKALPRRLQQSFLSASTNICPTHRGLDHHLITDLWSWVRHEFDSGIGEHIFPVIMGGKLNADHEYKIRQLEPVLQMWCTEFRTETSAPPGRDPISSGSKWSYQTDQCPACMLARIGSDGQVLLALYAGMIGRFPRYKLLSGKVSHEELTASNLDNPKSKRIRFVRYWLKASTLKDAPLFEAANLGIVLRKLHKEWKYISKASRPSIYGIQCSLEGGGMAQHFTTDSFCDYHRICRGYVGQPRNAANLACRASSVNSFESCIGTGIKELCRDSDCSHQHVANPKIGPQPRPTTLGRKSPLEHLCFKTTSHEMRGSTKLSQPLSALESNSDSDSDSTIYPGDSISVALLRINKTQSRDGQDQILSSSLPTSPRLDTHPRAANLREQCDKTPRHSTATSTSNSPVMVTSSLLCPSQVHDRSTHFIGTTSLASTTTILSYDGGEHALPVQQRQSIYFKYELQMRDPFEDMDVDSDDENELEEVHVPIAESGREPNADTQWSKLY
jgi:hypothetical protein